MNSEDTHKPFGKVGDIMTHIRNDRTRRQRRRAGGTLVLAAAAGGLLAAAMAASPAARADDPYTNIVSYVQGSIAAGAADYSAAGTDFPTAGDTNEGLIASFAGFDNIFLSPTDYTLLGLTAAATDQDFGGGYGTTFDIPDTGPTTAAGQAADAASDLTVAQEDYTDAANLFAGGASVDYFLGRNTLCSVATRTSLQGRPRLSPRSLVREFDCRSSELT
jgi:hypothetical protein